MSEVVLFPRHKLHRGWSHPPGDETALTCHICRGGLAFCTVCKGAEGDLTTDCPGYSPSEDTRSMISSGHINFTHALGWHTTRPRRQS